MFHWNFDFNTFTLNSSDVWRFTLNSIFVCTILIKTWTSHEMVIPLSVFAFLSTPAKKERRRRTQYPLKDIPIFCCWRWGWCSCCCCHFYAKHFLLLYFKLANNLVQQKRFLRKEKRKVPNKMSNRNRNRSGKTKICTYERRLDFYANEISWKR